MGATGLGSAGGPGTRTVRRRRITACLVVAIVVLIGWIAVDSGSGGRAAEVLGAPPAPNATRLPVGFGDLFGYRPGDDTAYAARAAAGAAQALFVKSPGGAIATAARVARYRDLIDAAVRGTNVPADLLEGLVFLESAGRSQVIAGDSVADATGLTQILAATGRSLLGMPIDVATSATLTRRISGAVARGNAALVLRLERERARADPRFDPAAELRATVRYLQIAEGDLGGRADLAVAAYHAGIGNIEHVLDLLDGGRATSFERLYFAVSPDHDAAAWSFLNALGDDSADYLWRVLEAERIMVLYRDDLPALQRLAAEELAWSSNALVLLDVPGVVPFASPGALSRAYRTGAVVPLPRDPGRVALGYATGLGQLAGRLGVPRSLYRGLRPSALEMLEAMAGEVRRLAPASTPLVLASAVLDRRYQALVGYADPPVTTGYAFDIARRYSSPAEAGAFQFVLDRLQALDLIAWTAVGPDIEVTVAPGAGRYLTAAAR